MSLSLVGSEMCIRDSLQTDGETEILGCFTEAVDDLKYGFQRVGEKGAVVSKQQLSDEFLGGFRVCDETPKVEDTAVCSETNIGAVWQVLFCLMKHDAEEDGKQCEGHYVPLLDAVGDWGSCPTVTHCASPDLAETRWCTSKAVNESLLYYKINWIQ